jgi:hypothetical protein
MFLFYWLFKVLNINSFDNQSNISVEKTALYNNLSKFISFLRRNMYSIILLITLKKNKILLLIKK